MPHPDGPFARPSQNREKLHSKGVRPMDKLTFGVTVMVVGMGGTLLTLWILSLLMNVLKKIFPVAEQNGAKKGGAQ